VVEGERSPRPSGLADLVQGMSAVRTAIKLAIVLVAAGALAWCFLFIYWHLRIGRAVRELQQGSPRAREVLHDAGCRALPYLVGAAKPSERLTFLAPATSL